MATIALTQDRVAVVDDADADLGERRWHVTAGYPARGVWRGGRRTIYMHQVIAERMGIVGMADHVNRDKLDCRRENLRPATFSQNNGNVAPRGISGVLGVSPGRYGRWVAEVRRNGIRHRKSGFATIDEAAAWRVARLAELGGY